jgi:quercetin dioxygenase-like cupin family protein
MNDKAKSKSTMRPSQAFDLAKLVDYADGAVVSRTIAENDSGTITLFAFDEGQNLSEHTAPFDAFVQILDGRAELIISGQAVEASAGQIVLMPANIPHAVKAQGRFKMLLTIIRNRNAPSKNE